jgi:enterochelin esterase-like enzyme
MTSGRGIVISVGTQLPGYSSREEAAVTMAPPGRSPVQPTAPLQGRGRRAGVIAIVLVVVALAAGGVTGLSRYISTYWAYRGFPPPTAPRSVVVRTATGTRIVPVVMPAVQSFALPSRALGGYPDQVDVVLPPGYAAHPRQRYPVLYLLHGFPGLPSAFVTVGRVAAIEATLVAAGQLMPMILVMPSGTRSYLSDTEWANGISPASAWETMIARDLVRAIDARYRTIAAGAARGLGGLSEGGYAALNIGLHHAAEFGLLESWSGYMLAQRLRPVFGTSSQLLAYNSPAVWVRSVSGTVRAAHTFIWFYSGQADPLAPQNRAFAAELSALGIAHRFYIRPGSHTWRLWRSQVQQALIIASEHLRHA